MKTYIKLILIGLCFFSQLPSAISQLCGPDCIYCDPSTEITGSYSATQFPPPNPIADGWQACGFFLLYTMSASFYAGSTSVEIEVSFDNCLINSGGLNILLMDGEECLEGDGGCGGPGSLSISYDDLVIGNEYWFIIDPCDVGCDFTIEKFDIAPFEIHSPNSISAYRECDDTCLNDNCLASTDCSQNQEVIARPGALEC